jgi:error-prone DNA polymerase
VHLVAQRLTDLSPALASVGNRDGEFPLPHGRGDEFHRGAPGLAPRERQVKRPATRDIYVAESRVESIKVKARDFH